MEPSGTSGNDYLITITVSQIDDQELLATSTKMLSFQNDKLPIQPMLNVNLLSFGIHETSKTLEFALLFVAKAV